MKTLPKLFPNASQSTLERNPHLSVGKAKKNDSSDILGARRGIPNKTESEFALMLEAQKRNGEIRDYLFHPFRLPWGMNDGEAMRYTPDFMVTPNSGLEKRRLIEVKGPHIHYEQQAIARFKGCRSYWPEFQFEMWQKQKSGWKRIH